MNDKIELNIIALAPSVSREGDFTLLLQEHQGQRQLPITIGPFEAQTIALGLEQLPSSRPQTHDLCLSLLERNEDQLQEVLLTAYREGVFFAQLRVKRTGTIEEIDARSSDAIALAVRKPCPIFALESVLAKAGMLGSPAGKAPQPPQDLLPTYSLVELQQLLQRALREERYERAKQIQALIDEKQQNKP